LSDILRKDDRIELVAATNNGRDGVEKVLTFPLVDETKFRALEHEYQNFSKNPGIVKITNWHFARWKWLGLSLALSWLTYLILKFFSIIALCCR
jgi:hypothetical protein